MVFSTVIFLCIFLPLTLIIYHILPWKLKNIYLLIASLIFYAWGEPKYVLCMLFTIAVDYFGALLISRDARGGKIYLIGTVIINLLTLSFFKYTDFIVGNIRAVFPGALSFIPQIVMPIGISFYTFQGISYVVDVYRDKSIVRKDPLKLALYISMFPQLIAGPIVRYTDVNKKIDERKVTANEFALGAERFILGLFKKSVLANGIGAIADQIIQGDISVMGMAVSWLGAIAYTLQIFYDFSGYSDMAIGIGKMLGFDFPENFKDPYVSKSISEFWRRWHISLSSWFKDYVYIPLGGSRKGNVYINLLIVFILTGIWHGAGWGFLLWGLWHGFFVIIERVIKNKRKDKLKAEDKNIIKAAFLHIYTLLVVINGWVLFKIVSVRRTISYLSVMYGLKKNLFTAFSPGYYLSGERCVLLVIAILGAFGVFSGLFAFIRKKAGGPVFTVLYRIFLILLLIISYVSVITGSYNPFIYFRF